jgi:hypothetical protein
MNTPRVNTFAGAWMNQKKENEMLKQQLALCESISHQNTVATITPVEETRKQQEALAILAEIARTQAIRQHNTENAILRKTLIDSKQQHLNTIQQQIIILQTQSKQLEEEIRELTKEDIHDTGTDKINGTTPAEGKKTRNCVARKPLYQVITQRTTFKTRTKNQDFYAVTEDGHTIRAGQPIVNQTDFKSLNVWLDAVIKLTHSGENKTKKSVYEVVYYYNNLRAEWRKLGEDYTSQTTILN